MSQEIERKFLVDGDFKSEAYEAVRITQGYLSSVPQRVVRVRVRGERGYLTVKGASDESGLSRFEWEKEITPEEAGSLLKLAEPGIIDKTRYLIKDGDGRHIWEVDEFHGENEGLVMAEIELESEDDVFGRPCWLGKEVTGDERYYNAYLSKKPYKSWKR